MVDLDYLWADEAGAGLRAVAEVPARSTFALAAGRLDEAGLEAIEEAMGTLVTPDGSRSCPLLAGRR